MTQTNDINKVLEDGFKKAKKLIYERIEKELNLFAWTYLSQAILRWEDTGNDLTGNTKTSVSVGVYMFGKITNILNAEDVFNLKPAIRGKFEKGEGFPKGYEDYTGRERGKSHWTAEIETDGGKGNTWAMNFLKGYNFPSDACGLVTTTGTEYSEFILKVRHYDTLESVYNTALKTAKPEWKKIVDSI